MPWFDIVWTKANIEHLADHGVSTEDAELVLRSRETIQVSRASGRRIAFGETYDGRRVAVVFESVDSMTVYPITAYEV